MAECPYLRRLARVRGKAAESAGLTRLYGLADEVLPDGLVDFQCDLEFLARYLLLPKSIRYMEFCFLMLIASRGEVVIFIKGAGFLKVYGILLI